MKSAKFILIYGLPISFTCLVIWPAFGAQQNDFFANQAASIGVPPGSVKLRLGNPGQLGVIVVAISPNPPFPVKAVQYVPPKGSLYLPNMAELYVEKTDLIGLESRFGPHRTVLHERSSGAEKDAARAAIQADLQRGALSMWKIKYINPKSSKIYLTIVGGDSGGPLSLKPNAIVQSGFGAEIVFEPWTRAH